MIDVRGGGSDVLGLSPPRTAMCRQPHDARVKHDASPGNGLSPSDQP